MSLTDVSCALALETKDEAAMVAIKIFENFMLNGSKLFQFQV